MQRITVSLPDAVADSLKREARRQNSSVSAVARDAFSRHLHVVVSDEKRPLAFAALGASGNGAIARNQDEALAEDWRPARDR